MAEKPTKGPDVRPVRVEAEGGVRAVTGGDGNAHVRAEGSRGGIRRPTRPRMRMRT